MLVETRRPFRSPPQMDLWLHEAGQPNRETLKSSMISTTVKLYYGSWPFVPASRTLPLTNTTGQFAELCHTRRKSGVPAVKMAEDLCTCGPGPAVLARCPAQWRWLTSVKGTRLHPHLMWGDTPVPGARVGESVTGRSGMKSAHCQSARWRFAPRQAGRAVQVPDRRLSGSWAQLLLV